MNHRATTKLLLFLVGLFGVLAFLCAACSCAQKVGGQAGAAHESEIPKLSD